MADVVAAVREYLLGNGIAEVHGNRLPDSDVVDMPKSLVIVRQTGGGALYAGYKPEVDRRIDLRHYGADSWTITQLEQATMELMHYAKGVETSYGKIHWCRLGGGPIYQVETDTGWESIVTTWQVYGPWLESD